MASAAGMALGTVAAGVVGSNMQSSAASKARRDSRRATANAIQAFNSVELPTVEDLRYNIEQFQLDDVLSQPIYVDFEPFMQQETELGKIQLDQDVKDQQKNVLDRLVELSDKGLSAQQEASLGRLRSDEAQQLRGQDEALQMEMQQRGIAGSGAELAQRLLANQRSADRMAQRGFDTEAMKADQQLKALMAKGDLASKLRAQEYGEQSAAARAQDLINQFNQRQARDERTLNLAAQQEAAKQRQRMAEMNVAQRNLQQQQEQDLQKYRTALEMERASGIAGQYQAGGDLAAKTRLQEGQTNANMLGGVMQGLGNIYSNYANQPKGVAAASGIPYRNDTTYSMIGGSDINMKKDIEPVTELDVNDFLEKLTGYKYKYKKPEQFGEGNQAGVMAQDLEQSRMGEGAVIDTPEGKMVDGGKLVFALGAAVASLNDKLKQIEQQKGNQ